jgi:outer membrane protein OmpA-like peptidoglycan-associated protein
MRAFIPAFIAVSFAATTAHAQARLGFDVERYEPTPAGQWSFMVDHPWYTRSLKFAALGVTLDYSHDALVFGTRDSAGNVTQTNEVVRHQLALHVDLAVSFLDRVSIAASLPIVLYEAGQTSDGVSPLGNPAVGDPRVGLMLRLFGQPLDGAFSMNIGADVWIPVGAAGRHAGDSTVRALPKLVLSGLKHRVLWSFLAGFMYRKDSGIGVVASGAGNTVGSELRFGFALAYADVVRRFSLGPEILAATVVTGNFSFQKASSSLEVLLGLHYNIARVIEFGLAGGVGVLNEPGTPDARAIVRLAYSPMRPEPKAAPPPSDRDGDGILDKDDLCPDVPAGPHPDRTRPGCPLSDRDGDGVFDKDDLCPDVPAGAHPDPAKRGCPLLDRDHDGIFDRDDVCPDEPAGPHPSATRRGCPDTDKDGDGVFDSVDVCPDVPAGLHPDPARPGCPVPDRDGDSVPDPVDACPDTPGAPSPDPKKNGCPGLVEVKNGQVVIMKPVYFATNKDVILQKSFPVLLAVADALAVQQEIKRLSIEGHTDDRGKPARNLDLSQRRAESVRRFLIEHGVAAERLEAHGYGQTQPISSNRTVQGRAANRRVEFKIVSGGGDADGNKSNN